MRRGFGVLEILVASAVISTAFVSLFFVFVLSQRAVFRASEKVRANFIAEEGLEVMRHLRDRSWGAHLAGLTADTNYYLAFDAENSAWGITASNPGLIDGVFDRTVRVTPVMRDVGSDDVVESGGVVDPDTWKVAVVVSWSSNPVSAETYINDMFDN
ncbi:MAG TPA: type II secretion system protein [Candidatus Paceibacterota bacterium]